MGHRELKRVPLNFNAPLNVVWKGYCNPYPAKVKCHRCEGEGLNTATVRIARRFYSFGDRSRSWFDKITQDEVQALVDEGRLYDFTHTWKQGEGWKRREDNYIPTADEVNAAQHTRGLRGHHDTINRWILVEARARRLGVYGKCRVCRGDGYLPNPDKKIQKLSKKHKMGEPPTGEGYQLWETCSEGSPISPVFRNVEDLAHWCADNATVFGSEKASTEQWLQMFSTEEGVEAGSMLVMGGGYAGSLANAPAGF